MNHNPSTSAYVLYSYGETFIEQGGYRYDNPYKFNGKELDEETGLYYYGARYYDPKVSLWLSVDPLAEKYPGMSPYTYTADNPVVLVDPDGRDWVYNKKTKTYVWLKNVESAKDIKDKDIYEYVGISRKDIHKHYSKLHPFLRFFKKPKINYLSFEVYISNEIIKAINKIQKEKKEIDLTSIRGLYENANFSITNHEAKFRFFYQGKYVGDMFLYNPKTTPNRFQLIYRIDTERTSGIIYPYHIYLINKEIWNHYGYGGGPVPTLSIFLFSNQEKLYNKFFIIDIYQLRSPYFRRIN